MIAPGTLRPDSVPQRVLRQIGAVDTALEESVRTEALVAIANNLASVVEQLNRGNGLLQEMKQY